MLGALRRGDLAGARTLRLSGHLTEFPREILGLADTLEMLDLGPGELTDLPADFSRLRRLRILFCSGHRFARLPPALGDCPELSQIGCRETGMREVPGEALPHRLRWLTLTGNAIETLPSALGERADLQKLMLAGNRLSALPATLGGAEKLELIRLSANRLEELPVWLTALPRLAWIAYAGNRCEPMLPPAPIAEIPWSDLLPGTPLGEGASGRILGATWQRGEEAKPVAVKLFKGAMTSDGLPEREMAAALAAGAHPHLVGAHGRITGHPDGTSALLMPLLPPSWRALANPPSLESCTRDVYADGPSFARATALNLMCGAAEALVHLHRRGLIHGDFYAHNLLWDGAAGAAVLGDFGAASALGSGPRADLLLRIETRAFGLLLGEVLDRCATPSDGVLRALESACTGPDPAARPLMTEVLETLASLAPEGR